MSTHVFWVWCIMPAPYKPPPFAPPYGGSSWTSAPVPNGAIRCASDIKCYPASAYNAAHCAFNDADDWYGPYVAPDQATAEQWAAHFWNNWARYGSTRSSRGGRGVEIWSVLKGRESPEIMRNRATAPPNQRPLVLPSIDSMERSNVARNMEHVIWRGRQFVANPEKGDAWGSYRNDGTWLGPWANVAPSLDDGKSPSIWSQLAVIGGVAALGAAVYVASR